LSAFQRKVRRGTRTLYNHVCHALTEVNLRRIRHVPEGRNWRDIPRDLLPAGMQRAKLSDHTKRYGRLAKSGLASTILTKCDPHWGAYVHPSADRTISVREAARLQGFPDAFRFAGDRLSKHYEQVGNAVPVPVAEAVARSALTHLDDPEPLEEPTPDVADAVVAPAVPLAA
jgi:DNA (cytosine-5)-methyltransferase 1